MNFSIKLTQLSSKAVTTPVSDYVPPSIKSIKADVFWNRGFKGQNVTIAVLDTGCDKNHPDLKDRIIGGRNFTSDDNGNLTNFTDYHGHGTHVAGTIAAIAQNSGIVGIAPEANLLILKVLNRKGSGSYKGLISAIYYAISQNADIISMSLGGPAAYEPLHQAIQAATDKGIPVVCAASNDGDGNPTTSEYAYPAYYPEVISVGATDISRSIARFSNSNDQVDLVAPGSTILSTHLNSGYAYMSGTSMAAPHVAGALALLINYGYEVFGRKLTEYELYAQLIRHCVSIGQPAVLQGNGMIFLAAQDILNQNVIF